MVAMTPRKKSNRTGVSIQCYISPEMREWLDEYINTTVPRTSITGVVEAALMMFREKTEQGQQKKGGKK